MKNNNNKSK